MDVDSDEFLKRGAKDYSETVAARIPEIERQAGKELDKAVEELLVLEKQTRLGEDQPSTTKLLETAVRICADAKQWGTLKSTLSTLAKRRQQFKYSTRRMVAAAMERLGEVPSGAEREDVISHLLKLTEGKIFVEVERARLTRMLAGIREEGGDKAEAARVLQTVQVETYGSMDPYEKVEFILEQMRLMLEAGDYPRVMILSRKISARVLAKDEFGELKRRFHRLMTRYYLHERDYLSACRAYQAVYDMERARGAEAKADALKELAHMAVYIVLAEHAPEQDDLLRRILEDRNLYDIGNTRQLLRVFSTVELIAVDDLRRRFASELAVVPALAEPEMSRDLEQRVAEHNVRVIAAYYRSISLARMAELMHTTPDRVEHYIAELVNSKTVWARIDRCKAVVSFRRTPTAATIRSDWGRDLSDIFSLVDRTCHLIDRERMRGTTQLVNNN